MKSIRDRESRCSQIGLVITCGLPHDADHLEQGGIHLGCDRDAALARYVHSEDRFLIDIVIDFRVDIPFPRFAGRAGERQPSGRARIPLVSAPLAYARLHGLPPFRIPALGASRGVLDAARPDVPAPGAAASEPLVSPLRPPHIRIEATSAERTSALDGRFRGPTHIGSGRSRHRIDPLFIIIVPAAILMLNIVGCIIHIIFALTSLCEQTWIHLQ